MSEALEVLEAAIDLARQCGDLAAGYFGRQVTVDRKADGSPVTIADRATESFAREWISERFPQDGIVGEEFGTLRPEARRRWVLDPIDGTASFIRGVPLWGTLVAVLEGDSPIAGVVNCPAVRDLVAAAPGEGCWWNGSRARVSTIATLGDATTVTTDDAFRVAPERRPAWDRLTGRVGLSRSWGDCYGYLLVATGRAEVMVDGALSLWDAAAVMPIVQEAGGTFTDWSGRVTPSGGSAIATNAALAVEVRTVLGATHA